MAEVKPGIEWALRPKGKEGKDFRVKLLTKAGRGIHQVTGAGLKGVSFEGPILRGRRPGIHRGAGGLETDWGLGDPFWRDAEGAGLKGHRKKTNLLGGCLERQGWRQTARSS